MIEQIGITICGVTAVWLSQDVRESWRRTIPSQDSQRMYFGIYDCFLCAKRYTVNEPNTWRRCSPDYCHDCYELPNPE